MKNLISNGEPRLHQICSAINKCSSGVTIQAFLCQYYIFAKPSTSLTQKALNSKQPFPALLESLGATASYPYNRPTT